jgi:hypothetical protein
MKFHKVELVYDQKNQFRIISEFFKSYLQIEDNQSSLSFQKLNSGSYNPLHVDDNSILESISFMQDLAILKKHFKHPSYSNEKEVRLIIEIENGFKKIFYRKTSSGIIIPYIEIPLDIFKDIVSITLHPLQNSLAVSGLHHYLKNKKLDLKDKVIQSKIPYREI